MARSKNSTKGCYSDTSWKRDLKDTAHRARRRAERYSFQNVDPKALDLATTDIPGKNTEVADIWWSD